MGTTKPLRVAFASLAALVFVAACAGSTADPYGSDPPPFSPPPAVKEVCVETVCPAPYATCGDELDPCSTDLRSNVDHCGACDTPCPPSRDGVTWVCSEGQCRMACEPYYADCNLSPTDGCETPTASDPKNCGACGKACDEGVLCWRGACGCPNGLTQCGQECKNLSSDNANCGACGSQCKAPDSPDDPRWMCGPSVTPANTGWTCQSAACSLQCKPRYGNCNDDFCGDGCETDLGSDPKNCGACGNVCGDGQRCVFGSCQCPAGTVNCGRGCTNVLADPENCGACGSACPGPSNAGGGAACVGGTCSYVCTPGWADCNGSVEDGCEANLVTSQFSCGACGVRCEAARGQPCVQGVCLTKKCEDPVLR